MEETNYIRWLRLHLLNTLVEFCTYLELKIIFTSSSKWFLLLTASLILISLHLIPIVRFEKRLSIFTFTILVQCKPFTTFWTEWSLIAGTVGLHTASYQCSHSNNMAVDYKKWTECHEHMWSEVTMDSH